MVIKDISYIDDELDNVSILNDIDFSALVSLKFYNRLNHRFPRKILSL